MVKEIICSNCGYKFKPSKAVEVTVGRRVYWACPKCGCFDVEYTGGVLVGEQPDEAIIVEMDYEKDEEVVGDELPV